MKRTLWIVSLMTLGALMFVLFGGCSKPPSSGTIIAKHYHSAQTTMWQQCVSYGKYGCKGYIYLPHTDPARYELCLRSEEGKKGCFDVDQQSWHHYETGDQYPEAR